MRYFSLLLLALPFSVACANIDDDAETGFDDDAELSLELNQEKADHLSAPAASCVDAPGFSICGLTASEIFHGMDVTSEDLNPIAAVGNLPTRSGDYQGEHFQCLLTGRNFAKCTVMPSPMLRSADAVRFLIKLWNTPGSTMSGKLSRFQFMGWPDSIPTGNWGASANRTLGPYRCQARLAFVGNSWTVDVDASDSAVCRATVAGNI